MDFIDAALVQDEVFMAEQMAEQRYQQEIQQQQLQQYQQIQRVQQQQQYAQYIQQQQFRQEEIIQSNPIILNPSNTYAQQQIIREQQIQKQQLNKEDMRYTEQIGLMQSQRPRISNAQFQSPIYYNSFFQWKEGIGSILTTQIKQIRIGEKIIKLNELTKIKIMKETAINNSRKIKLTHFTHDILFSVEPNQNIYGLPMQFYWFAKIITDKLRLNGCDLNNPYIPQSTFINKNVKNSIVHGILFKQSQYLKAWELRFVAITPEGLFSYKDQTSNQTFSIKRDSVTQIWTRFDLHERLLVIKVRHSSRKTQFGIPIVDYCNEMRMNWLYAFYGLVYPS